MPGRLAQTDSATAIPEVIGSGPYRLVPEERVVGSRIVDCHYDCYVPREGTPSMTSGPKHAHFERMEGHIITDTATSAAALQTGEIDWWSAVLNDCRPVRQRNCDVMMDVVDTFVLVASLRPNHLHPPFNNPAKRRALLPAITQADFMQSIIGNDRTIWRDGVGCFPVNSPMASDEGISVLTGPRDTEVATRAAGRRLQGRDGRVPRPHQHRQQRHPDPGRDRHDAHMGPDGRRCNHGLGHAASAPGAQGAAWPGRVERADRAVR
jgi:peptide/nickel transport system substrate-binding protein